MFLLHGVSVSFALGENKHGKKHDAKVQRAERAEGAFETEQEEWPQQWTRPP